MSAAGKRTPRDYVPSGFSFFFKKRQKKYAGIRWSSGPTEGRVKDQMIQKDNQTEKGGG